MLQRWAHRKAEHKRTYTRLHQKSDQSDYIHPNTESEIAYSRPVCSSSHIVASYKLHDLDPRLQEIR